MRVRGDRRLIPGVRSAVVKEPVSTAGRAQPAPATGLRPDPRGRAAGRGRRGGGQAAAAAVRPTLEISVRTADIAEAATWVRGVERTGPRELRFTGQDPLAVYRSFCAAILLTRTIAEVV